MAVPVQESAEQDIQSLKVICGSPLNLHFGNARDCVSSTYAKLCNLLESGQQLKKDVQQQLQEMKEQLEHVSKSIESLSQCMDNSELKLAQECTRLLDEVSASKQELAEHKQKQQESDKQQDVRIKNLESESAKHIDEIKQLRSIIKMLTDKIELDDQGTVFHVDSGQQMEERRRKRRSAHLEDSLEKMKEFAESKTSNRNRFDSGISISSNNSAAGLILPLDPNEQLN